MGHHKQQYDPLETPLVSALTESQSHIHVLLGLHVYGELSINSVLIENETANEVIPNVLRGK